MSFYLKSWHLLHLVLCLSGEDDIDHDVTLLVQVALVVDLVQTCAQNPCPLLHLLVMTNLICQPQSSWLMKLLCLKIPFKKLDIIYITSFKSLLSRTFDKLSSLMLIAILNISINVLFTIIHSLTNMQHVQFKFNWLFVSNNNGWTCVYCFHLLLICSCWRPTN